MTTLHIHPEYLQRYDNWVLAKDLYEGVHSTLVQKYLWYHQIEKQNSNQTKELRSLREERTRYKNLTEIGVSIWQSLFFRTPPTPDKKLKKLLEDTGAEHNIDGMGTSLNSFVKNKVLVSRLNYGKICILADSFPIEARTLKEQKDNKLRPYLDIINPLDAVDWAIDYSNPARIGKYDLFRHVFYGVAPRKNSKEEPQLRKYSRELTVTNGKYQVEQYYVNVDKNFKVVEDYIVNGKEDWRADGEILITDLKEIPVSVIDSESWFKDANEESLRYFNLRSNKDNILHQQGYQDKYIVGVDPTDTARINAFNEYSYKLLPENGNAFAIEPIDPASYERAEAEAQASFFNVTLNKLRLLPNSSDESQAADAINKENEYTYALVEADLDELENVMNDSFKNFALLMGDENFDGKLEFNKQITPESFQEFINLHMSFRDVLSKIEGYDKAAAVKAIKKARFDTKDEEALLKIAEETDFKANEEALLEEDPIDKVING